MNKTKRLLESTLAELKKAELKLYEASDNCDDYHAESQLANAAGKVDNVIKYIIEIINEA